MRVLNWQSKLAELIKFKRSIPFVWGSNDCCLFVCDAIKELVGVDPAESFRGRYDTEQTAKELVEQFCGADVEKLVETLAEKFGFMEVKTNFAKRGDIGIFIDKDRGPMLGVCNGASFLFLIETEGIVPMPARMITRAWSIE